MASNYFDKASLVMIPDAPLEGKVLSVKPEDRSGDFTFTRSSAATRVNADGNIEKETMNLLLQSNSFDTTWSTTSSISLTSGQSGYDGSNDAWLLARTSTGGQRVEQTISSSGVQTYSVYAKANVGDWLYMRCNTSGSPAEAYFDLANGTLGASGLTTRIDAKIEAVGNGWYRCSMVFNNSVVEVRLYPTEGNGSVDGTNESIYIQDAQLEQGLVARDYQETTTAAVYGGITDNTPRLDYTDSSCPALLLEPLRTNRVTNSEYLNGTWSENLSTLIVNNDTSPEGVDNATKLQEDTTASNTHFIGKGYNYVSGTTYSWSVYAKADGRDEIAIQQGNPNVISFNAVFNFTSETATNFGNGTARIEDAGNGWYRCIIEGTTALLSSGTNINVFLRSGNSTTYTGDGTSGVLLYGFQLEEESYATSYIPTYGSSVSRVDDLFDLRDVQTNGLVTSTQGTMFFHITDIEGTAVVYNIQTLNDLSYALRFVVRESGYLIYQRVNNVQTTIRSRNDLTLSEWKIAMSWNGTSLITSVNGTSYIDTIDASIASQLDKIARVNPQAVSVTTNQILVFPTQLTEAELNDLTTL